MEENSAVMPTDLTAGQDPKDLKNRLINDPLRPYFIKWKFGSITNDELNEIYIKIKAMIWNQIYRKYCSMDNEDLFNSIWLHIQDVLEKWDENSPTYVSTWLHFVIINWIKYMQYKEIKLHSSISYIPEYIDQYEEDFNELESIREKCVAVRACIDNELTEVEKKVAELMFDPDDIALQFANSKKKYQSQKISKQDICALVGIDNNQLEKIKNILKEKFDHAINNNSRVWVS